MSVKTPSRPLETFQNENEVLSGNRESENSDTQNPYPLLDELDSLRDELKRLMISNNTREQISPFIDLEVSIHEFELFLASRISPEFKEKIQALSQISKTTANKKQDAIHYFLMGFSLFCTGEIYKLLMRDTNPDAFDKIISFLCTVLAIGCLAASAVKISQKNELSLKDLERIRQSFSHNKEPHLVQQLFDYLYLTWEVRRIGEKYSISANPDIRELGEKMKTAAADQSQKTGKLMSAIEELINNNFSHKQNSQRKTLKAAITKNSHEMVLLLREAQKFNDTPLLTPEQMKMLN